jgi:hypothetical protein
VRITLALEASAARDPQEVVRELTALLRLMTVISVHQFRKFSLPRTYDPALDLRYVREPRGRDPNGLPWIREEWQDAATTAERREGDCEDLAVYLAADLQVHEGVEAWPKVLVFPPRPGRRFWLFHIVVELPDGTIRDPSRLLGMET